MDKQWRSVRLVCLCRQHNKVWKSLIYWRHHQLQFQVTKLIIFFLLCLKTCKAHGAGMRLLGQSSWYKSWAGYILYDQNALHLCFKLGIEPVILFLLSFISKDQQYSRAARQIVYVLGSGNGLSKSSTRELFHSISRSNAGKVFITIWLPMLCNILCAIATPNWTLLTLIDAVSPIERDKL